MSHGAGYRGRITVELRLTPHCIRFPDTAVEQANVIKQFAVATGFPKVSGPHPVSLSICTL